MFWAVVLQRYIELEESISVMFFVALALVFGVQLIWCWCKFSDSGPVCRMVQVEHGFKGNCFPVIVADPTICRELQILESKIENEFSNDKTSSLKVERSQERFQDYSAVTAREEVISLLNELGWLFQKSSGRQVELRILKDASFLEF